MGVPHGDEALWIEAVRRSKHFFDTGVLPELVGKYFTKPPAPLPSQEQMEMDIDDPNALWCYCHEVESGMMIKCCNAEDCQLVYMVSLWLFETFRILQGAQNMVLSRLSQNQDKIKE